MTADTELILAYAIYVHPYLGPNTAAALFAGAFGLYLLGLARLGFNAGLAWFVVCAVLALALWPVGAACVLAIAAYGLGAAGDAWRALKRKAA